ncbi:MAG: dihydroorotase [Acidobacteria bacterium]|nr:dihydroorotase [Acidobacteriota bacterium]
MKDLLIRNGRIIDTANGTDTEANLLIRKGRIEKVGSKANPSGIQTIDAKGKIVAPGFIDLHTHLREPGFEHKETIRTGTAAAIRGGFTAVCAMANTLPPNDERAVTEMILAEANRNGLCRVYPVGAVSKRLAGEEIAEMADLAKAGCVAFSDDGRPVMSPLLMRRALEYSSMLGLPISVHLEDLVLGESGVMHEGYYSTLLGMVGMPAASEEMMAWRDVVLAAMTGGRLHIAHLSTAGAIEAVRYGRAHGAKVTCEATPHHLALTDAELVSYSTSLKMKPPLRSREHVDALINAIEDGTIDAIATDHAPHHPDEKDVEFDLAPFGIIGLETAFAVSCEALVHGKRIGIERLIELLTSGPAAAFSLPGGRFDEGEAGDVTIVDPEAETSFEKFQSKAVNSPFRGKSFRGRVEATIVGGEVRYAIDEEKSRTGRKAPAGSGRKRARR